MEQLHIGNEPALLRPVVLCLTVCVRVTGKALMYLLKRAEM